MSESSAVLFHPSPVGVLELRAEAGAITTVEFTDRLAARIPPANAPAHPLLAELARQLDEYFGGARRSFDVPLRPQGTAFQQAVWRALLEIGYGETRAYSDLAARAGYPGAWRATGAANGANPIAIVIPCHRCIGSNGTLTGYAGGLERKRMLLGLERDVVAAQSTLPLAEACAR